MRVRFKALMGHPRQRAVNSLWVEDLALRHFENGNNVQKGAHPIMVMAAKKGPVGQVHVPGELPKANPEDKFYLISGQHRVAAMTYVINARLALHAPNGIVNEEDVMSEDDAEWPAVVFKNGS